MTQEYNFSAIWNQVLQSIAEEIDASSFDIWFSMVNFETAHDNKLYISVPNSLTKEWIESRYLDSLQNKLRSLTNQEMELILSTESQFEKDGMFFGLNHKYTFDTFVVGNSNRFAHAACYAVGEAPSKAYNPLFIYGGVGLGKTHLMQAIGHHILRKKRGYTVVYVSSEQFTNELIGSIKDDNMAGFRNKYRGVDVLLVDDIQFLAGKERTQEEFFHTFNTLYESDKQVVISSDRAPRNIPTLEDRLRSRFEWGLITDIQPPDLETRIAILRKKAQLENYNVPYDILDYIANYIDSNIRELEGALVRLVAFSTITNKPLNMATAIEALKDILPPPQPKKITIESIQNTVSKYYGVEKSELLSKKRNKHIVYPRQIAMYLCRRLTEASFPQIGEQFGGRDHTTVMHANEKIERNVESDGQLAAEIKDLCEKINPDFTT
ncbi:MAG TPA: chromosomal replication initiator protein DnaA [Gelria sp.]|jgi:chromosomal replication initiator protein|nr:chromosomal replication initiator protein DnaA [Gelria sp.]